MAKRNSNSHEQGKRQASGLSAEQLKTLGADNTDLWRQAQKQRDEYVGSLEMAIRSMTLADGKTPIPEPYMIALLDSAKKTKVNLAMREPAIKDKGKATVTVVWDFDDFVYHSMREASDAYLWPKQFVDDFKTMTPMPNKMTDHKALAHSPGYVGWRERMMKQRGG